MVMHENIDFIFLIFFIFLMYIKCSESDNVYTCIFSNVAATALVVTLLFLLLWSRWDVSYLISHPEKFKVHWRLVGSIIHKFKNPSTYRETDKLGQIMRTWSVYLLQKHISQKFVKDSSLKDMSDHISALI